MVLQSQSWLKLFKEWHFFFVLGCQWVSYTTMYSAPSTVAVFVLCVGCRFPKSKQGGFEHPTPRHSCFATQSPAPQLQLLERPPVWVCVVRTWHHGLASSPWCYYPGWGYFNNSIPHCYRFFSFKTAPHNWMCISSHISSDVTNMTLWATATIMVRMEPWISKL